MDGNPIADPNPRLVALLAAARRGAQVCVLLDLRVDDAHDPRGNRTTVAYLNDLAAAEGLNVQARVATPHPWWAIRQACTAARGERDQVADL